MKTILISAVALLLVALSACVAAQTKGDPVPLNQSEIKFLKKLEDPTTFSLRQEMPVLFQELGNLLTAWKEAALNKNSSKHVRIRRNLDDILMRRVYVNFETILDQLQNGSLPNRQIAAGALGFSKIPENDKFPQVYPRAVKALVDVLNCGNDKIVKNALLSLYNIADPETPLDTILDIMTRHHAPDVRANAALALQAVVTPEDCDKVLPYLFPGFKDDDALIREHCVLAAYKIKDPSVVPALLELLDDYPLIQAAVARTLGEMNDITLCGYLIPKLRSRTPAVRECTLNSLIKLSNKDYGLVWEDWWNWWKEYQEQ